MKKLTEQEALFKLTALCASGEHCQKEMTDKLQRWEIDEQAQARIMQYLIKENYIDEQRYCRAFIKSKLIYNKWGRRKIEQALYLKQIPSEISKPIFDEYDRESYKEVLKPILEAKKKTIKAESEYERNGKLIRFALGKGFDKDAIQEVLREI